MSGGVAVQGNSLVSSPTGAGVEGYGQRGVVGLALPGGTGVLALTALDGSGTALHAAGPAQFDGAIQAARSGLVSIAAGKSSATATGVSLTTASLVLATVQNNAGVSVVCAVPNVPAGSFTIPL